MTSTVKSKPTYKTEKVVKDNGTVVNIGRCTLENLDTLLDIQERLIKVYVENEGAFAKIITKPEVRSDLESLCSLLPIIGNKSAEHLYFEEIQDNWEQLIILFFNGGLDENTREVNQILPSKVAQLHFLPYLEVAQKYIKEYADKAKD